MTEKPVSRQTLNFGILIHVLSYFNLDMILDHTNTKLILPLLSGLDTTQEVVLLDHRSVEIYCSPLSISSEFWMNWLEHGFNMLSDPSFKFKTLPMQHLK